MVLLPSGCNRVVSYSFAWSAPCFLCHMLIKVWYPAGVVYISLTAFMVLSHGVRSVWRQPEFRAVKAFEGDYHNYKWSTFSAFSPTPSLPAQLFPSTAYGGRLQRGSSEKVALQWQSPMDMVPKGWHFSLLASPSALGCCCISAKGIWISTVLSSAVVDTPYLHLCVGILVMTSSFM